MDSHGSVVSHLLTLLLLSLSQNSYFLQIPFGMLREVRWSLDDGLYVFQYYSFTTMPAFTHRASVDLTVTLGHVK